jgi:hypothetical protein
LIPSRGKSFIPSPEHPDWIWGSTILLFNKYWNLFLHRYSGWGMKLIIHLHLELRIRMCGAIPLIPLCAFVAETGTTLPLHNMYHIFKVKKENGILFM